jgi:Sulfatase
VLLGAGLALPNLLSLVSLSGLVDVGLPPRTAAIFLYVILAVCARRIPYILTVVFFVALIAFDIVFTLSMSFGLAPNELVGAIKNAHGVHVLESPLYIALIAAMAATTFAAIYLLSKRNKLIRGNTVVLFVAAALFAACDYVSNADAHYYFGAMYGRGVPNVSATNSSGFADIAGVNGRNVILVMVESLGNFIDESSRARIVAPIYGPNVTEKYKVTHGLVTYYGSTTSGEMRELCDTRAPFADFTKKSGHNCLPARLHMHGYTTTAIHGFSREMFEREHWYPLIGFDKMVFGEALLGQVHRTCGHTFRGVCDADLPPLIEKAVDNKRPNFIYWLTLNTHIPVAPHEALTDFGCDRDYHDFGLTRVCRMAELWHDVFRAVAQLALDPAIGPAEILIVGDHAPPLWSRSGRAEFEAGKVPWYRLTPRDRKFVADGGIDNNRPTPRAP